MTSDPISLLPSDVRAQLAKQLARHEDERLRPYTDTVGKLTIGIGRNLDDVGISRLESAFLLENDINRALRWLVQTYGSWFTPMDPIRQAALVNMGFNLGAIRFAAFQHLIEALKAKDYELAARQMLASRWAEQVGHRAIELAEQMRTGAWQPPI